MSSSDFRVLNLSDCEEVKLHFFWNGDVDDPDDRFDGVPEKPTVEDVKKHLIEKGVKDPFVVQISVRTMIVFAWVDASCIESQADSDVEIDNDSISTSLDASVMKDAMNLERRICNARVHAISHAFDSFKPLFDELEKKGTKVSSELMEKTKKAKDEYNDDKSGIIEEIDYAEKKTALKPIAEKLEKYVVCVRSLLKEMFSGRVTSSAPNSPCKQCVELENRVRVLTEENDGLKNKVKELEKRVKELESRTGRTRKPEDPDVVNKSFVFKHPKLPEGVEDDHIYLMRSPEYPFAFFYLQKEFLDTQKGLDLTKDITCLIKTIERHCSSQSEKELTAKYRVRLGEDFFLCTGTLSQ